MKDLFFLIVVFFFPFSDEVGKLKSQIGRDDKYNSCFNYQYKGFFLNILMFCVKHFSKLVQRLHVMYKATHISKHTYFKKNKTYYTIQGQTTLIIFSQCVKFTALLGLIYHKAPRALQDLIVTPNPHPRSYLINSKYAELFLISLKTDSWNRYLSIECPI